VVQEERHATEPWCSIEDVVEGPVSAVLHTGRATYACRTGRSPKYELLRAVHDDGELRRCLAFSSAGALEVSLLVDGAGHVEVALDDEDEAAGDLTRCVARLRFLHPMKLGCRWRVEVMLGAYSL
jgi:hypothetical protein